MLKGADPLIAGNVSLSSSLLLSLSSSSFYTYTMVIYTHILTAIDVSYTLCTLLLSFSLSFSSLSSLLFLSFLYVCMFYIRVNTLLFKVQLVRIALKTLKFSFIF